MTIRLERTHKLVLLAAILFAAGSTVFMLFIKPAPPKSGLHYNCFKQENGWGYDVLYNDRILIHQPMIPGKSGSSGFNSEKEAGADAQTVIEKIKSGEFTLPGRKQQQRSDVLHAQ